MKTFKSLLKVLSHPLNRDQKIKTIFILIWWKTNQIIFKIPAIVELLPGVKCICYPSSSFGSLIVYTSLPEYAEMNFLNRYLTSSSVFFDVGAGIGDYSLIAASKIKTGKIYSFEPVKESYDRFSDNINLNKFNKVIELSEEVISDKKGHIFFSEEVTNEISHISSSKGKGVKKSTISLDSFIKTQKIAKIDLIKIDVEGAESLVLKGMKNAFKKKIVNTIILELNSNSIKYDSSSRSNVELLQQNGFICFLVVNNSFLKVVNINQINNLITENVVCVHKSIYKKKIIKVLNEV